MTDYSSKNLNIKKTIFSHEQANDLAKSNFSKLAKSEEFIDESRVINLYDSSFYNIPKNGRNSHENIVEKTFSHIRGTAIKRIESNIQKLTEDIKSKEAEFNRLDNNIQTNEDPLYENGALIAQGVDGVQDPVVNTKWVMQEGKKRMFANDFLYEIVKRGLGRPSGHNDGRYFLSAPELNKISNGQPINSMEDLNLKGTELFFDGELPLQEGFSLFMEVEFECAGNEVSDFVSGLTNSDDPLDTEQLQFYLNNDACIIKYIFDEKTTDEVFYEVKTETINAGETKILKILRNSPNGQSNIPAPSIMQTLWDNNIPPGITYNGNTINNYVKEWGPYNEYFKSIIYAEGRIYSTEKPSEYIQNILQESQDTSKKLFNGLPSEATGAWYSDPTVLILDQPGQTNYADEGGQGVSNYGTPQIFAPGNGFYGGLNQNNTIQEQVFDNLSNHYYLEKYYGQPIIRWDNMFIVIYDTIGPRTNRRVKFKCLTGKAEHANAPYNAGDTKTVHRSTIRNGIGLDMDYSGGDIYGMKWDSWKFSDQAKERVWEKGYIGLKGYQTKEYTGNGNAFNDSSNYEYTQPF